MKLKLYYHTGRFPGFEKIFKINTDLPIMTIIDCYFQYRILNFLTHVEDVFKKLPALFLDKDVIFVTFTILTIIPPQKKGYKSQPNLRLI